MYYILCMLITMIRVKSAGLLLAALVFECDVIVSRRGNWLMIDVSMIYLLVGDVCTPIYNQGLSRRHVTLCIDGVGGAVRVFRRSLL